jgi:hypothetical protein
MNLRHLSVFAAALLGAVLPIRADEVANQWVAKARAYLGTNAALDAVQSLRFQGSFAGTEQVPDSANSGKMVEQPVRVSIDIIFQQPMQQRQVIRSDRVERVTALDGYDAWEQVVDLSGKNKPRVTLLDAMSNKRLRATTVENLSFYSDRLASMRQVRFLGEETVDGIICGKLSFTHASGIVFLRYFDRASGHIVKTVVEGGGEIREEGELIVKGVRFPRKVINTAPNGRSTTINFEEITVNDPFPPESFAVPTIASR